MADPEGNTEFCFLENPNVRLGEQWGRGETILTVSAGPVIKCFVLPPNST